VAIKQKHGAAKFRADLMVLTGNALPRVDGGGTPGFAGGRADVREPESSIGVPGHLAGDERHSGETSAGGTARRGADGLIYVNPEGPNGNPDPIAGEDPRNVLRMAMNDKRPWR
jgi:catalase-peroxidase